MEIRQGRPRTAAIGAGCHLLPESVPVETGLKANLRLCITSLLVTLCFLCTAAVNLGHPGFQVACLTYLLKSYLLTLLLALGGLILLAAIAFYLRRETDQRLSERYVLIAFFVPAMMLVNLAYFTLKAGSAACNVNLGLIQREYPLWQALRPLFASWPYCMYQFLDFAYTTAWFVSLSALPLSLILLNPSDATRLNCAVMLLLGFTALGNVTLLTYSPVYEFPSYFSYLPENISTWKLHHASLSLTHKLINLKQAVFTSHSAGFFQPVAAFPAFHTSYAFLLFLAFRNWRYVKFLFLAFFILVVMGGLVLGYHGFLDTALAAVASTVIFLPISGAN